MSKFDDSVVLIPAFNPDSHLSELIHGLLTEGAKRIVLVNDGSSSRDWFTSLDTLTGVHIIHHEENLGKGAAIKTGFRYILKNLNDSRAIITADADGQHLVSDIARLAEAANPDDQLILGTRQFDGAVPIRSAIGNRLTRKVMDLITGVNINDTQTGLRLISLPFAQVCCELPGNRYQFELDTLLLAKDKNIPIREVPISTIYIDKNVNSHFRPILDSILIYGSFLRYCSVSLLSFMVDIVLFALLLGFYTNVFYATFIARGVSSLVNFSGNKYFAFRAYELSRTPKEILGYILLAACSVTLSATIVSAFHTSNAGAVALKLLVDTSIFFANYALQRRFIFKKRSN